MLETLDYTIRIGSIPTFLYFDLYLDSAYAAHFVYLIIYIYMSVHAFLLTVCEGWVLVNTEKQKHRKQLDRNRIKTNEKKVEILRISNEWNMGREDRRLQELVQRK